MPTYEYRCAKCGHEFEEFQAITAEPIRKCPQCGKKAVERLIGTGAGIIFKGSGFYETDYKRSGGEGGKKRESPGDSGSPEGSGGGKPCSDCSKADSCPASGGNKE
ncbi:MAG: FmdB family zinc ribbon protein [Planctomycetota bacterium]|jgi:putative FmdB family regulatory protein